MSVQTKRDLLVELEQIMAELSLLDQQDEAMRIELVHLVHVRASLDLRLKVVAGKLK